MWRLKLGEGANNPYLWSSNNFVGRQTWDFEADEGTPEERAQIEAARKTYFQNRFKVQCSNDLFWKFQFLREKNFKQTIPKVVVEEGGSVTKETATIALRRATTFFAALQSNHGHWPAENSGPLFYAPPM
ncbi:germanicol synthase-like, partial [Momordica charantia]